jgi:hypothetical protein
MKHQHEGLVSPVTTLAEYHALALKETGDRKKATVAELYRKIRQDLEDVQSARNLAEVAKVRSRFHAHVGHFEKDEKEIEPEIKKMFDQFHQGELKRLVGKRLVDMSPSTLTRRILVIAHPPGCSPESINKWTSYERESASIVGPETKPSRPVKGGEHQSYLSSIVSSSEDPERTPGAERPHLLEEMNVVVANWPFGSGITISRRNVLTNFELANVWDRDEDGTFRNTGMLQDSVDPEILSVEQCVRTLRPHHRVGIVLPQGFLSDPKLEYIGYWILRHCWVLASIVLPACMFTVGAYAKPLGSLLFLKKKTIGRDGLAPAEDYPIFMSVAKHVGLESFDNYDLPTICERYQAFRYEQPEPGSPSSELGAQSV